MHQLGHCYVRSSLSDITSAELWPYRLRQIAAKVYDRNPCFYKVDLCVIALLLDENISYVPPLIVIQEARKGGKPRALFTRLCHCSPPPVLDALPITCESATCAEYRCIGMSRMEACRTLHYPSSIPM
ncbi:hypothetical protein EDD18DRAFT_1078970 [Armillaria luteobubalina]|uniref:Uncharacterized protein n=1 Tax=Armillaria luteobubalina TaxID=153913 RepID=A0AA39PYH3_9AGAR|nr:hypothetical protein EDD18DRAFT_1078970 [Armillaria luteobubalina]